MTHIAVLQEEIKNLVLKIQPNKALDFTFGGGTHSKIILENSHCTLLSMDRDPNINIFTDVIYKTYPKRFRFVNDVSYNMKQYVEEVDFILGDLGLSQIQLNSERGFAYNKNSKLDMSMGVDARGSLIDILPTLEEREIGEILREYGEEENWKKIAKNIYNRKSNIYTSEDLKLTIIQAINNTIDNNNANKVLSRCFQAFRIYINKEITTLDKTLQVAYDVLKPGGTLAIITFNSLEDRAVKLFFKFKLKYNKLISPTEEEIEFNSQSRSAKLRIGTK